MKKFTLALSMLVAASSFAWAQDEPTVSPEVQEAKDQAIANLDKYCDNSSRTANMKGFFSYDFEGFYDPNNGWEFTPVNTVEVVQQVFVDKLSQLANMVAYQLAETFTISEPGAATPKYVTIGENSAITLSESITATSMWTNELTNSGIAKEDAEVLASAPANYYIKSISGLYIAKKGADATVTLTANADDAAIFHTVACNDHIAQATVDNTAALTIADGSFVWTAVDNGNIYTADLPTAELSPKISFNGTFDNTAQNADEVSAIYVFAPTGLTPTGIGEIKFSLRDDNGKDTAIAAYTSADLGAGEAYTYQDPQYGWDFDKNEQTVTYTPIEGTRYTIAINPAKTDAGEYRAELGFAFFSEQGDKGTGYTKDEFASVTIKQAGLDEAINAAIAELNAIAQSNGAAAKFVTDEAERIRNFFNFCTDPSQVAMELYTQKDDIRFRAEINFIDGFTISAPGSDNMIGLQDEGETAVTILQEAFQTDCMWIATVTNSGRFDADRGNHFTISNMSTGYYIAAKTDDAVSYTKEAAAAAEFKTVIANGRIQIVTLDEANALNIDETGDATTFAWGTPETAAIYTGPIPVTAEQPIASFSSDLTVDILDATEVSAIYIFVPKDYEPTGLGGISVSVETINEQYLTETHTLATFSADVLENGEPRTVTVGDFDWTTEQYITRDIEGTVYTLPINPARTEPGGYRVTILANTFCSMVDNKLAFTTEKTGTSEIPASSPEFYPEVSPLGGEIDKIDNITISAPGMMDFNTNMSGVPESAYITFNGQAIENMSWTTEQFADLWNSDWENPEFIIPVNFTEEGDYEIHFPSQFFEANGGSSFSAAFQASWTITTAGIKNVNVTTGAADAIFDLQGRKVAKAAKGIFIINGRKTVVK